MARTLSAATSPDELVRKSLDNFKLDHSLAPHYTYMERDVEKNGDATKVSVAKVITVNGLPFEMTVSRNGAPLSGEQLSKEQAKLEKRKKESGSELAKRELEYRTSISFLDDVPNAYTFKIIGQDTINGRENYVVQCTPKPGFKARETHGAMFAHIGAKLWIDKVDLRWAKAEAKVLDTISIGWVLARIGPGAEIRLDQSSMGDGHWLPSLIDVNGEARVLLVKDKPIREHITYFDFQRVGTGNPSTVATVQTAAK